jgi:uncharacterized membrane protein (UPF0127 family)
MWRGCSTLIGLVLTLGAVACGGATAHSPAPLEPSEPFTTSQVALVGPGAERVEVSVYVADTPEERARGLMYRDQLPRHAGMIFRYPEGEPHRGGYWMKNTRIPLSIAFFGTEGEVLRVLDMQPCTAEPCPLYDPGISYAGAIEVNQGYFAEVGAREGWTVEVPADLPPAS